MKLQGPETTVSDCKQVMNGFCRRLILWCDKIKRCNTEMFPELSEILDGDILSSRLVKEFVSHMTNLVSEITTRFMEIQEVEKLNFVVDPFTGTTDDVAHISCTAEEELNDIQNNLVAK